MKMSLCAIMNFNCIRIVIGMQALQLARNSATLVKSDDDACSMLPFTEMRVARSLLHCVLLLNVVSNAILAEFTISTKIL
jgi:hypothetical protein